VDPGDATHPFNLSLLLGRQDRTREALDQAEEAFRLCPAEGVYRGWRAILLRRSGRHGEALVELQRAAWTSTPWCLAMPGASTGVAASRRNSGIAGGRPGGCPGLRLVGPGLRRVAAAGPAGRAGAEGVVKGEPSWRTAVTEA